MWFCSIFDSANFPAPRTSRRSKKRRRHGRRATARPRLEALESRRLLTFMAPVDYPAATYVRDVAAGDFANNGIQDLATIGHNGFAFGNEVSVLLGKGDGTFQAAQAYPVPGDAFDNSIAVGDVTGDGKLDIVVTGYSYPAYGPSPGSVSVLVGNGDGTFQPPVTFNLPYVSPDTQVPLSVALGDMNHDGRLDAIVTTRSYDPGSSTPSGSDVDVLLGHGDGTLSLASSTPIAQSSWDWVTLADFNDDGNLDVAASTSSGVAVLLGNGDGTLSPPMDLATGGYPSIAAGDVNGDGKVDLVAASAGGTSVSVLLGNGDGTFQSPENIELPSWYPPGYSGTDALAQHPDAVVVGDLNGDGKMDLAVTARSHYELTTYSAGSVTQSYLTYSAADILLGNGGGSFTDAQIVPLTGDGDITAADFNGDGYPGLALPGRGGAEVLLNGANWSTTPPTAASFAVSGFPSSTTAGTADNFTVTALNADGSVDTAYTGTVRLSSTDGQATLPAAYTFTAGDAGKHTFSATLKTAGTQSITATDSAAGTLTGSETGITVIPAAASHFAVSAPASSTAGSAFSVTVTALDPYNNTATVYAGTVHFASSDGQAVLPGNYTFTSGDAGNHTFTNGVTFKTAGNQTLTATDTSSSAITGDAAISVTPAAPSTILVSGFPSPITAGAAGSFTVTALNANGTIDTGYTGTVRFNSSDGKAVLPATYTFTAADAGKHTFSATLKTAGTQSITVSDTLNASLHGSDSGITVKPAAASKFVLSAPSSVMPGQAFSLTVTVEDAYGNLVTGYVGTIHFSSSDSRARLPANYTFTAGDKGVHTFTGVVLKRTGNQTITVTDRHNSRITGKTVVDVV